jgi:hypothetical protein
MNKNAKILPPIFAEQLKVHNEIDDLLEIDGSTHGPAGIASLDLGGELRQRDSKDENWNFDLSVDFARPKKLTNIVIDSNSLSEYRGLFEVLIGGERAREASESFRRNEKNLEPKIISKSEKYMHWAAENPFANYVLAECRADDNQAGDIRELFARIESFSSLNSFADSVEKQDRYQAARNVRDIQRSKDRNLAEMLGDLRFQVPEIAAEDSALLSVLESQLRQFDRQEMNSEFRVTKLLMELHLQIESQAERARLSGTFIDQDRELRSNVREIRNQGFFSDLEKYFASSSKEQKAFFDGEEIFLQEEKVERNLDTLQVSFVSPLLAGKWVRVIDRENRTPVALAEVLPNRRGAIAEIRLPFQAREDDLRFFLTSDPLQAKDQTPLTVRIRAIREGQIAAQRERAVDSIGAAWHWLHCSNLWKIIDEPSTAKTAARWAKSQFERGKSEQMSEPDEDEDISNAIDFGPFRSSNQDVLGYGLPSFSKNFSISNIASDGFSSKGSNRRNFKAKRPSKTTFLTDTAWSVLDDLGL